MAELMLRRKMRLICASWAIIIIISILRLGNVLRSYSPYFYGFLSDPTGTAIEHTTLNYIHRMHLLSPIYTAAVDVMQVMTGTTITWLYIPGAIFIFLLVFSQLPRDMPMGLRAGVSTAAILGPAGLFGYYYVFSRDAIDMILLLTFISIIFLIRKRKMGLKFSFITFVLFSSLIWLNHYSFWPLFALTVLFISLSAPEYRVYHALIAISSPVVFAIEPAKIFVSSAALISTRGFDLSLLTSFGGAESLPSKMMVVGRIGNRSPAWMPTYQYLGLGAILGIFVSIYGIRLFRDLRQSKELTTQRQMFLAVGLSSAIYASLLVFRGYIYRASILWPLIILSLSIEFYRTSKNLDLDYRKVTAIAVSSMVVLSLVPMATPYFHHTQNVNEPSMQQRESISFTQYTTEGDIYTDLLHGSLLILNGERSVVIGESTVSGNGTVAVDSRLQTLAGEWHGDGKYALITTEGDVGVRTWHGTIPPLDMVDGDPEYQKTYDNGQDSWYTRNHTA
ncbi:hypothetical protein [Haloferax volcanii]|uniref:hypothetical protein n=1 Tax=Haloferax volcanii TaxID=2246 RepID=UPI00197EBAF3|nr:hypothetical protein [Haloferax alexandrinus]